MVEATPVNCTFVLLSFGGQSRPHFSSLRAFNRNFYFDVTSGQSYKRFTLVIYDSRVVIWGIFKSGMTLES